MAKSGGKSGGSSGGNGRKNCQRGKSCGGTCIDPRERCVLELGPLLQDGTSKVKGLLAKRSAAEIERDEYWGKVRKDAGRGNLTTEEQQQRQFDGLKKKRDAQLAKREAIPARETDEEQLFSKDQIKVVDKVMKEKPEFAKVAAGVASIVNREIAESLKDSVTDEDSEFYGDLPGRLRAFYSGEYPAGTADHTGWMTPRSAAMWITTPYTDWDPSDKSVVKEMREAADGVAEQTPYEAWLDMVGGGGGW